ncbi:MAG: AAA family ATPase [Eubacterium sp.]|nr:AAA family ATPase [Eubacterium sp.]
MARTVAIGIQNFGDLIQKNYFYIDKTAFIKEWWDGGDSVTLIARPRRFGKTLNMSMVEQFFSIDYAGRKDLFEGLFIWKDEKFRRLQGTYPVISLSFARVKETDYVTAKEKICEIITNLYIKFSFLRDSEVLTDKDRDFFDRISTDMRDSYATSALYQMSDYLCRYYGKKVIILLDEYDTPMQEAYVHGYWDALAAFTRSMFNSSFKANPYLERAIMTGITRVSKESVFSDLNNLKVVTTTSDEYAASFGFTEQEVCSALKECGLAEEKEKVKRWYNGFIFGTHKDIYNPWSILNFLDTGRYETYWANTSSNSLVGKLLREGSRQVKADFEKLLNNEQIWRPIDEQIVYNQLDDNDEAVFSLLLASGYLKALDYERADLIEDGKEAKYELALTNYEVRRMFEGMVSGWFAGAKADYNDFIKAMMQDDIDAMNAYMNRVALSVFSYFDTGKRPSGEEPERFYHGFVLGMIVELQGTYMITSNRESGFGRYDVMLEPKNQERDSAFILEFKVFNERRERSLEDTAQEALRQIKEKGYEASLIAKGIPEERIRKYGFAFKGKEVWIVR